MFRNPATDLIVILVIAVLILGPKRLPLLGRQLGQGLREFKDSITGEDKEPEQPQLTQATPVPASEPRPAEMAPSRESAEPGSPESRS